MVLYVLFYGETYRDLPGTDPNLLPAVRALLKTFSVISYGDFDEFEELRNVTGLSKLNHLNITELLLKVIFWILQRCFSKTELPHVALCTDVDHTMLVICVTYTIEMYD